MNAGYAAFVFYVCSFAGDLETRCAVSIDNDFDVMPRDLAPPASFQSL